MKRMVALKATPRTNTPGFDKVANTKQMGLLLPIPDQWGAAVIDVNLHELLIRMQEEWEKLTDAAS